MIKTLIRKITRLVRSEKKQDNNEKTVVVEENKKVAVEQTQSKKTQHNQNRQNKHNNNHNNKPNHHNNKPNNNKQKPYNKQKQHTSHSYNTGHQNKNLTPPTLISPPKEDGKVRFCDLNIDDKILYGFQDLGFKYCTPIQAESLPQSLQHKDVVGKAQTGTGKTAAFLTAAFDYFIKNPIPNRKNGSCRALVLAPTRELALQIHKDAQEIGKYCNMNNVVVFGGMDHHKQQRDLNKPVDILVGTPGRVIDFMLKGILDFSKTDVLVIDEADRMLDMGFVPDVKRIVSRLPRVGVRQTLFYSATITYDVKILISSWLNDPLQIEIAPENIVADLIEQKFYSVLQHEKMKLLNWIIKQHKDDKILIFVNRKDLSQRLLRQLRQKGIRVDVMSGDVRQEKRLQILNDFKSGALKIIIATDVAARGIHVKDIGLVINYDLPNKPEDYVHRIGRTGRAGAKGKAISFVCESGAFVIGDIEELLGERIDSEQPEDGILN